MTLINPAAGTISWFARHEFNLSWRDFMRMMSAGKPGRERFVIGFMALSVLIVHAISFSVLKPVIDGGLLLDKALLSAITGCIILTLSLMMSQAMELATRVLLAIGSRSHPFVSGFSTQTLYRADWCDRHFNHDAFAASIRGGN